MSAFTPEQEQRLREIVREEMNDRFGVALTPEQWRAVWAEWDRCKAMADEAQLRLERATQDGSALRIVGEDGPEITFTPMSSRGRPKVKRVASPKAGG